MVFKLLGFIVILVFLNVLACSIKAKSGLDGVSTNDCLSERKSIQTILVKNGNIIVVADQHVILSHDGNSRYIACNLPDTYRKHGMEISCDLVVKETYPNEKLIAIPVLVKEIHNSKP